MTKSDAAAKRKSAAMAARLEAQAPDGWATEVGEGYIDASNGRWPDDAAGDGAWVLFTRTQGDDLTATVALNVFAPRGDWEKRRAFGGLTVEGHTGYNGGTFTRVGFDVSSCELSDDPRGTALHSYGDLAALLEGEWARCLAAHARSKTAVAVPGLPFTRQPEWFAEAAKTLRAGKTVTLSPHGMGTGYTLVTSRKGRLRRPGGRSRADERLEQLLGVSPVYVEAYDHD